MMSNNYFIHSFLLLIANDIESRSGKFPPNVNNFHAKSEREFRVNAIFTQDGLAWSSLAANFRVDNPIFYFSDTNWSSPREKIKQVSLSHWYQITHFSFLGWELDYVILFIFSKKVNFKNELESSFKDIFITIISDSTPTSDSYRHSIVFD